MAAAKKILKLDNFAIQDDFFSDVALIGIASNLPVYSLCNILNRAFRLSFCRQPWMDVRIGKQEEIFSFPVYQHKPVHSEYRYILYKLKTDNVQLLPSLKNMDYLWMVSSEEPEDTAMDYLQALKHMAEIQFASLLELDRIRNIEYLIL